MPDRPLRLDRPVKLTLTRHADHDPASICRPALGYGLCEVLETDGDGDGEGEGEGEGGAR